MGRLIVLDGLDGSGKATQAQMLAESLAEQGRQVRKLSFPDYSHPSSALIRMYLAGEFGEDAASVNAYAASSFYAVDRVASFLKYWKEDYNQGIMIIADRYTTSNAIHQMVKLPQREWEGYLAWMEDYEYNKLGLPKPSQVIYLDMPPEISRELLAERYQHREEKKDLHERDFQYLLQCRQAAYYAADRLGWVVVPCSDGERPYQKEEIHRQVLKIVVEEL